MKTTKTQVRLPLSSRPVTFRLVWFYYVITPLFLLVELLWGIDFRVPALLSMPMRYFYYTCCFGCGAACFLRPRFTPVIAFVESTINVILIFVGFGTTLFSATLSFADTSAEPQTFSLKTVYSFAVTATIWVIAFYHAQAGMIKIARDQAPDRTTRPEG